MATYEQPEYDTPKGSAIDAILESSDVMVFWFPSETEPGCYALKPRWEEYIAEFFPTLEYRQAEDLAMLMDPFANGTACVVGSKRELDYWLAEAERKAERRQRQPRTAAKGGDHTLEQETHNGTNGNG